LDNANHGKGQPRLSVFDLETGEVVHSLNFDKAVAPEGSHLNDFQVHPNGSFVFIADASILGLNPALLIADLRSNSVRRVLEGHESVMPEKFIPVVQGRKMELFGVFAIRHGVDSIALNRRGTYLYFGAVTSQYLYRVPVSDLQNPALSRDAIAERVVKHFPKPESDGITIDN
jgi:sugar lactone lactonase YvrE